MDALKYRNGLRLKRRVKLENNSGFPFQAKKGTMPKALNVLKNNKFN